jgi:hypothetical protein
MSTAEKPDLPASSQLFTLRVWTNLNNDETWQTRYQVKHVLSGATHTFLDWAEVIEFIEIRLRENGAEQ